MITQDFIDAKRLMEFYMDKLKKSEAEEAMFAEQYANLNVLKYRIESVLDILYSYEIDVKYE